MTGAIAACVKCRAIFRVFSARHGSLLSRILRHYDRYHGRPLPKLVQLTNGQREKLLNSGEYLTASMSAARRNDDPLRSLRQALVAPIGRKSDMEGGGTPVFLSIAEPMLDHKGADDRMLRNARSESMIEGQHGEALNADEISNQDRGIEGGPVGDGNPQATLKCDRMDNRKRCATCGRRSHLRFTHGALIWYRCRRDLTENERKAFEYMLWKARQYKDSLAGWKEKNEKRVHEYKLELSTRAEVGQDAA